MNKPFQYQSIAKAAEGCYKEKGSTFLSFIFPLHDESEIKLILPNIKKEHPSARHICFAWRLGCEGDQFRSFDAGEPSGTAGKPIYNILLSKQITYVLLVVVRYFGGSKLGVPGLIHAYKSAAEDALSNSEIVIDFVKESFSLSFNFDALNKVMQVLKEQHIPYHSEAFDLHCAMQITIKKNEIDMLSKQLNSIPSVLLTEINK